MGEYHTPALLQEVSALLQVTPDKKYIDATLGGGGHTLLILSAGGQCLSLDQDEEAITRCRTLEAFKPALVSRRLILAHSNFSQLGQLVEKQSWKPVSGIIFDLGVSSHQIDTPGRGFSFQKAGPLDMRMDRSSALTASKLVNELPEEQLASILTKFGEVPNSRGLAKKIVASRPIDSTLELAQLVFPYSRQVFQALRIAVNDELGSLNLALPQALETLEPGGRLIVISFHSLEDRIVKNCFLSWKKAGKGTLPVAGPVGPTDTEISHNPRVKSAKLRVFQKI